MSFQRIKSFPEKSEDSQCARHLLARIAFRLLPLTLVSLTSAVGIKAVLANPQYVEAYFYQFVPSSCKMSHSGYGRGACEAGAISVGSEDRSSVNLHIIGKLGQWQFLISQGNSFMPQVDVVLIRSLTSVASKKPKPDFYYTRDGGGIKEGSCTPITITPRSSGRCVVTLEDGKTIDVSFETNTLKPVENVQKEYPRY
ncbi:hypothetical protein [Synechococcus sp. 1G10]|uniref:hypothetical protein n=1 Tax=Synechococcus sp. 1G10 TaxID=2025605 RepID=UPI001E5BB4AF|nr:hypothetical protein [Synechococcus sp. 1G10]